VRDAWNMTYVPDEATQSKLTLRDREVLAQLPLVGGAILSWNDNWWLSRDYSSPSLPKPAGYETKAVHEPNECVEWAGIMSLDTDLRGTPRQACLDLTKANQILLESPDGGRINAALPVSAYLNEAVDEVEVWIDGEKRGRFDKTSPHWVEKTFRAPGRDIAKHALEVRAFDSDGKLLGSASRTVWTARNTALPTLVITSRKDEANRVWFTFDARDDRGRPLAGQKIQWGALDAVTWIDQNGELTTDENGRCELKRPMPANYIQISGGFDYARGDFKTRITDLAFYRQR